MRRPFFSPGRWALVLAASSLVAACDARPTDPGHAEWQPPGGPAVAATLLPREPCADHQPLRQALFGDVHVHTGYSMDARARGARSTPADAYRYARGEEIAIAPYDEAGVPQRTVRIDRPLDFAAVTDHAEFLGEVGLCTTPGAKGYDSTDCRVFRGEDESFLPTLLGFPGRFGRLIALVGFFGRNRSLCGPDGSACRGAAKTRWDETRAAAEDFYDRSSACDFTTFVAWEYSRSPGRTKVHRNVLLRNEIAPELPISWIDEKHEDGLRRKLEQRCNQTGTGCQAIAIPHNPNKSNGQLFTMDDRALPRAERRKRARLRARLEPVVEMMQIKGESECASGMYGVVGPDEYCDFEKTREMDEGGVEDCELGTGDGAMARRGCRSRLDFVRYALVEGLREGVELGVNPLAFGFIGSTDTHNAIPGAVEEKSYPGSTGEADARSADRLARRGDGSSRSLARNPGGLAGVWAEENSRDSIFEAFERRETFATSGPRIQPRFFGGWGFEGAPCDDPRLVARGYEEGVPMGGDLPPPPAAGVAPTFVVSALADPGIATAPGGLLQRIQIVKGWPGDGETIHQAVYDVAGGDNGATVDEATCRPHGPGARTLCGVWRDPEFDPDTPAVYYARVLENPSCRWSTWQCRALPDAERPPACSNPEGPRTIQERAWTSPIFWQPGSSKAYAGKLPRTAAPSAIR